VRPPCLASNNIFCFFNFFFLSNNILKD
jgi:hypothetical protein